MEECRLGMIAEALKAGTQDSVCGHGVIRKRSQADMAESRAINNSSMVSQRNEERGAGQSMF